MSPENFTRPVTKEGVVIDAKGDYVEILEEYPNLAPVEDAILVDLAGSGQVCRILRFASKVIDAPPFFPSPRSLRAPGRVTQGA